VLKSFNYKPMAHKDQVIVMEKNEKLKTWFKRLGWAGFLFFLIKGIAWLVVLWLGKEAVWSWLS
jgi:hypothetical protein